MVFLISIISLGAVSATDSDAVSTDDLQITDEVTTDEPIIAESYDDPIDDESIDNEQSNVVQKNITLESDEELSFEYGDEIELNVQSENSTEDMAASIKDNEDNSYYVGVEGNNILLEAMPIGQYTLNITTANITKLFDLSIIKASPALNVEVQPQYYVDEGIDIQVTMPSKVDGIVSVEIDGVKQYAELDGGNAYFYFNDLIADNYTVIAKYWGNENYNIYINETEEFEVIKRSSFFYLDISEDFDGDIYVRVHFPDEELDDDARVNGDIIFIVDGDIEYEEYVDDGYVSHYFSDLEMGNHTFEVQFPETYKYLPYNVSETFTVKNGYLWVTIDGDEVGNNVTIIAEVPKNATGNITVTIDDDDVYTQEIKNGRAEIIISGLGVGFYYISVEYSGDEKFDSRVVYGGLDIYPLSDKVELSRYSIFIGENVTFYVLLADKNATGNVSIIYGDEINETAPLVNGSANITVSNFTTVGYKDVEIFYYGDNGYESVFDREIHVKEALKPINIIVNDIAVGDIAEITVDLNNSYDAGDIGIKLDNMIIDDYDVSESVIALNVSDLSIGSHNVTVYLRSFDDEYDELYLNSTIFNVNKLNTTINVLAKDIAENETVTLEVNIDGKATGIVLADINGKKSYAEISNGKAAINVDALEEGNYTVSVTYIGDEKYAKANTTVKFQVKSKSVENETNVTVNDTSKAPENITVVVNGVNYTAPVVNGTVVVDVPVDNSTDGNNNTSVVPVDNNTSPVELNITVPNSIKAGENATVSVNAPANATGNITVKVDGKEVATVPLVNGSAEVPLNNLTDGAHLVEVIYSGDDQYAPNTVANAIAVSDAVAPTPTPATKKDTVLLANATLERVANEHTKTGENGTDYFVTLKDADGNALVNKTVQIAINGVHYYVQTDENGSAHQTVSMESANVYTYAFAFQGDDEYNAAPLNSTRLTVTKKATTLTAAKKVTFKKSAKTKKVTVTLGTVKNADGKVYLASGKTVTLKVNGKTYKAKTNAKNQAVFKVKLTKKATYKANVKFAGSKIYDSSKASLKIVVK